ncbi:MAG: TPM domain-containing protein [Dysgonamonadaceae bacterium]|jgi:uncharacterized membrane protein|nr:TPM domain-containing protein [Dysgonamonadaceae bacterium]
MDAKHFFSDEEKERITEAIRVAEMETSGEIRVHISADACRLGVLNCAAHWFEQLKMHKTELRNGVLFFLSVKDRQFAVIGDAGINRLVPDNFWEDIKNAMSSRFKEGRFAEGLSEGIRMAGNRLKAHFPRQADDVNELPDDLSFS